MVRGRQCWCGPGQERRWGGFGRGVAGWVGFGWDGFVFGLGFYNRLIFFLILLVNNFFGPGFSLNNYYLWLVIIIVFFFVDHLNSFIISISFNNLLQAKA